MGLQSPPLISSYPDPKATVLASPGTHTLMAFLASGPQTQGNEIAYETSVSRKIPSSLENDSRIYWSQKQKADCQTQSRVYKLSNLKSESIT